MKSKTDILLLLACAAAAASLYLFITVTCAPIKENRLAGRYSDAFTILAFAGTFIMYVVKETKVKIFKRKISRS